LSRGTLLSTSSRKVIENELADFREKKLTKVFFKKFTLMINTITKEREAAKAVLAEFER
jgi:hypothetical protein